MCSGSSSSDKYICTHQGSHRKRVSHDRFIRAQRTLFSPGFIRTGVSICFSARGYADYYQRYARIERHSFEYICRTKRRYIGKLGYDFVFQTYHYR